MSNPRRKEPLRKRNKYWVYENIKSVHVELSTLCNSICPWCPRYNNFSPNLNPNITEETYSVDRFINDFPVEFIQRINFWTFAGDFGDPCTAPDIIPIVDYINKSTIHTPTIKIHTNGGMKTTKFWHELGMSMNSNSYVIFSVDGLEDTNHIYRRNVKWDKVINNMRTYSKTGARAEWDYLKFKHNEHQYDEAQTLADELGFKIVFKNPNGFEGEPMPARDKDYNVEYYIHPADERQIPVIEQRTVDFIEVLKVEGYDKYKDRIELLYKDKPGCITCSANHVFGDGGYEVRVNCDGTVWPCSFYGHMMKKHLDNRTVSYIHQQQAKDVFKDINNNLHAMSLKEILDGDPFRPMYDMWDDKKILQCYDACGPSKTMDKIYA